MKRTLAAIAFAVVAVGVFAISDGASATNGILEEFTAMYPATTGTALAECSTCHTSVPALNAYGSALAASGMNFAVIEDFDSDGDGSTNLQEIRSLTNPGVASDHPASTTTSTTSTTSTPSAPGGAAAETPPTGAATLPSVGTAAAPSAATPYDAGGVGTVWLAIENGILVVKQVDSDWTFTIETDDTDEIEVTLRWGDSEVEFEAELDDGTIRTEVETDSDDDRGSSDEDEHDGVDSDDDRGDHYDDNHDRGDDDHDEGDHDDD